MKLLFCLVLLVCSACVTSEKLQEFTAFPKRFASEQQVTFFDGTKETTIPGNIERSGKEFKMVFFDPLLGMPLVGAERKNGETKFDWFIPYQPSNFDPNIVTDALMELYETKDVAKSDLGYVFSGKLVKYTMTDISGDKPCQFPKNIVATSDKKPGQWLKFEIKSLSCN